MTAASPADPVRTLWLLRHAKAVADPPDGGDDFDRVLAPRGRRDAAALGQLVAAGGRGDGLGLGPLDLPQVAFVSPAARTTATAELVLGAVAPKRQPDRKSPLDLYGADPEDVLAHLRSLKSSVSSAMVVGHNPTAQALALGLVATDDDAGRELVVRRGFPTCALAIYRLEVTRWRDIGAQSARLLGLFVPPFDEG